MAYLRTSFYFMGSPSISLSLKQRPTLVVANFLFKFSNHINAINCVLTKKLSSSNWAYSSLSIKKLFFVHYMSTFAHPSRMRERVLSNKTKFIFEIVLWLANLRDIWSKSQFISSRFGNNVLWHRQFSLSLTHSLISFDAFLNTFYDAVVVSSTLT